jgi:hypothetical protein
VSAPTASIDELLRYEEVPPPAERRPESIVGWTAKAALVAGGLTALIALAVRLAGVTPPYLLIFAGVFALLALRRVMASVAPPPPSRTRSRRSSAAVDEGLYSWGIQDALQSAPRRWESRLGWAKGEVDRFTFKVQPPLQEIVDERLRQRYGLTLRGDPVRARAILGDPLWTFLTAPPARPPGPRELAGYVGQIERLKHRDARAPRAPRPGPHTHLPARGER